MKAVLKELLPTVYKELRKTGKFVIPRLARLKLKRKPATEARVKMMFGREVKVRTKPAKKVIKASPSRLLPAWAAVEHGRRISRRSGNR